MAGREPRNTYKPCIWCGWDDHHMAYKCAERIEAGVDKVLVRRDDLAVLVEPRDNSTWFEARNRAVRALKKGD